MDAKEFNRLLKIYRDDTGAANTLNLYCLTIIKKRLAYCNGSKDIENLSHSILFKFISHLPDFVVYPKAYLTRCTNNYLSTLKKKMKREAPLTFDVSYEQRHEELEKFEINSLLEKNLGEQDAYLMYSHYIEGVPEKQLAEDIGLSYSAVRQRIRRAKEKLKIILSQTSQN